jgi:hypothetical protein
MASRARGFVSVPNGFVWDERIFMRQGNKRTKTGKSVFVNAKKFLIKAGADPSPSVLLGAAKDQVLDALTASILEGIENAGKDR